MAIRYNTILDRPYNDETGRFISWDRALKSSTFRAGLEEYEDYIRQIARRPPVKPVEAPEPPKRRREAPEYAPEFEYEPEPEEFEGSILVEDVIKTYLEIYDIDPEDINDSP